MARQPKILIADEPTGNLDPETAWGIVRLLEEINNFGTTILVTTHDDKIVNQLKKRVVTLRDGQIIGDQKNNGYYDLDATHSKIVKRPLATAHRAAPTAVEIRNATNSKPQHIIVPESPAESEKIIRKAAPKRRFIN